MASHLNPHRFRFAASFAYPIVVLAAGPCTLKRAGRAGASPTGRGRAASSGFVAESRET